MLNKILDQIEKLNWAGELTNLIKDITNDYEDYPVPWGEVNKFEKNLRKQGIPFWKAPGGHNSEYKMIRVSK